MILRLMMLSFILLGASNAFAIYQCASANGSISFQDTPCAASNSPNKPKQNSERKEIDISESLIRNLYKDQANAVINGNTEWLCNILDEDFTGIVKIAGLTIASRKLKKYDTCNDYRVMYSMLERAEEKPDYKVNITSISIDSDKKKAIVKSNYSSIINLPKMSSKGSSTDTLISRNGKVYIVRTEGVVSAH